MKDIKTITFDEMSKKNHKLESEVWELRKLKEKWIHDNDDRNTNVELRKKNSELECEVCELRKLKQKWVDDRKDLARYKSRVRELENDKNVWAALKVKNTELEEAVKGNLVAINVLSNEICNLTDEKCKYERLVESLRGQVVRLEKDTKLVMSANTSCSGGGNNVDVGVTTFQDIDEEFENHTVEPDSLPRNEGTRHSLGAAAAGIDQLQNQGSYDAQGASSSDMEILHKDAQGALSGMEILHASLKVLCLYRYAFFECDFIYTELNTSNRQSDEFALLRFLGG